MSNIRVIYDNAIERATLTASPSAANFPAANLQAVRKSDVWRATGTTAAITATWATPETIQAVVHPHCNWSPTATERVRVTTELSATNVLTAPADFTNAAWTKTNVTVSAGVAGPDGTNSAATITASAANATISQSQSVSAGNYASAIFIRRRTGTGAVSIRNAANGAWLPLTLTSAWARFANDGGSVASSALLSLQLATSGDAVDVAFAQVEAGSVPTSYYPGTRPLGYIDSWQSYAYDSGASSVCPAPAVTLRGFTAAQAAGAYAYGGGATARTWLPAALQAYGLRLDISDAANLQGYLESSTVVAGPYWESATNFDYGASAQPIDSSKSDRNDAGDLISDPGTLSFKLNIPMSKLAPADRTALWGILRSSGSRYPVFVSMFPGSSDLALERDHQVFGKLVQLPAMSLPFFNIASATVEVESI